MKILRPNAIKTRLGLDPNGKAQSYFTNLCYKYMDKYVPLDTGDLRSNVILTNKSITYNSPYAHYMYEGKVMGPNIPLTKKGVAKPIGYYSIKNRPKEYTGQSINYHTSGTGPHWDERMKSADMNQVTKLLQKYVDRGA